MKILLHIAEAFGLILALASLLIIWDYPVWKAAEIIGEWRQKRSEQDKPSLRAHPESTHRRAA